MKQLHVGQERINGVSSRKPYKLGVRARFWRRRRACCSHAGSKEDDDAEDCVAVGEDIKERVMHALRWAGEPMHIVSKLFAGRWVQMHP
jgi:hypothetical protein